MWRFVQLSDLHLGSGLDGRWNNRIVGSLTPEIMRCLRIDLADLRPEFVVVTGDIAGSESRDTVFAARDLLDSLGVTYYPGGGNCDFVRESAREWFLEAFETCLPRRDTVYAFTHGGLHFCVLDPWWRWSDGSLFPVREEGDDQSTWAIPPHQLAWLADELEAHRDAAGVVLVHHPPFPLPDRMRRLGLRDAGCLANGDALVRALEPFPQVKLVLSGHAHLNCITRRGAVTFVTTSSLTEYPIEYRDIHVHEDRLEIHTRGLSDTLFAGRSLIAGGEGAAGAEEDRFAVVEL